MTRYTQLPIGTPEAWDRGYRALERKAVTLMGWECVRGVTPDDLAQGLWNDFVTHLETKSYQDAIRLTSYALGQDAMDIYRKTDLEVFVDDDLDCADEGLQTRYLGPDWVDWMADHLTERELEVMILHIEEQMTVTEISQVTGLSKATVSRELTRSGDKLRERATNR